MKRIHPAAHGGFSLVEVTLTLGIVAYSLLAVFGLLAVGQKSDTDSVRRLGAAHSASELLTQRRAFLPADTVPVAATTTDQILPGIKTDNPDILSGTVYLDENNRKQAGVASALYRLDYRITTAPTGEVATVRLRYSWPPTASGTSSQEGIFEITSAILIR